MSLKNFKFHNKVNFIKNNFFKIYESLVTVLQIKHFTYFNSNKSSSIARNMIHIRTKLN